MKKFLGVIALAVTAAVVFVSCPNEAEITPVRRNRMSLFWVGSLNNVYIIGQRPVGLVKADHRTLFVVGARVDLKDVLHFLDVLRGRFGYAPPLP